MPSNSTQTARAIAEQLRTLAMLIRTAVDDPHLYRAIHADQALVCERAAAALTASVVPEPPGAPPAEDVWAMIEQLCRDLNAAHNEILRLQGVEPEAFERLDWPEWSAPANSIRWAERVTGKSLSKTSLRGATPPAAPDTEEGD